MFDSALRLTIVLMAAGGVMAAAAQTRSETRIDADIWADNWYALYVNGELVAEDAVPFATERSFNADSFTFAAGLPAQAAIVLKDYFEDDSGLEYIGSWRQQIGDGGAAAQFKDADTGELLAVSSRHWQCHVVHQSPLNRNCVKSSDPAAACRASILEAPLGWTQADFDDSAWQPAVEYSARAIRPHGGYRSVDWEASVRLIWSRDIEIDNVVLCRFMVHPTTDEGK